MFCAAPPIVSHLGKGIQVNRGLVKGDSIDRRVIVAINGPVAGRRRLLAVIRSDFDRIHSNFTFRLEQNVPAPGQHDVRIPYMKLLALERAGITYTQEVIGDDVLQLKVSDLINGVDLEQVRPLVTAPEQPRRAVRAFISYAHKDESLRAELETHLKIFRRQGLLDLWYDRDISAGAEWKEQIDSNLEGANLILFLVSADFVASDYCYDKELATFSGSPTLIAIAWCAYVKCGGVISRQRKHSIAYLFSFFYWLFQ